MARGGADEHWWGPHLLCTFFFLCCIDVWETYSISTIHVGCQRRLFTVIVVVVVVVIVVVNVAVAVPVMYWYCVVCLFFVFDGFLICLLFGGV